VEAAADDPGAKYDKSLFRGEDIEPQVTWGTNPGQVRRSPRPRARPGRLSATRPSASRPRAQALEYMGLKPARR
jgi:3-isopropylmalate/(R)-2-methylmalate dehydratase large subunit